jgi:hypothetical protein
MDRSRGIFIAAASAAIILGVILIIAFPSPLPSSSQSTTEVPPVNTSATPRNGPIVSIQGLKKEYAANEPVTFAIRIQDSANLCHVPDVKWLHADSREVAYDIPEVDAMSGCTPIPGDANITLELEDYMSPYKPIIPHVAGSYILLVELERDKVEKGFVVGRYTADLDWQPDKSLMDRGRIMVQPKTYFDEEVAGLIDYCIEWSEEDPWGDRPRYGDRDNPIILERNGDEVSINFCIQSTDEKPRT